MPGHGDNPLYGRVAVNVVAAAMPGEVPAIPFQPSNNPPCIHLYHVLIIVLTMCFYQAHRTTGVEPSRLPAQLTPPGEVAP